MKKIKKVIAILAVCSIAALGVGCSTGTKQVADQKVETDKEIQTETIQVTHQYGEVQVPKNPQSVVVTDFGLLDTLQALEVETITGVPQDTSSLPTYLEEFKGSEYVNVGGLKEPNFEVLYELQPDLILIAGRQASQYEELSKIAPVVYMEVDTKDYIGSFEKNVTLLGEIFGKEEKAREMISGINEKVEQTKILAEQQGVNALITMVNKGEVSVFGAQSRFGIIHNTLGLQVADQQVDDSTHGQVVTFEYLLKINPDYLFVVDKNALPGQEASGTAKDVLENNMVKQMKAYEENKIIYLDTIAWYITSGGATATEIMVNEIHNALQTGQN